MGRTEAARNFDKALAPQIQAVRKVRETLAERKNDLSLMHGVDVVAEQVDILATAIEEMADAIAKSLERPN